MEKQSIEELKELYRIGTYIRKANFEAFRIKFFDNTISKRYIKIYTADIIKSGLMINGIQFTNKHPIVLTKEEADQLQKEWDEFVLEDKESMSKEFEHFKDGGEAKQAYIKETAKHMLFKYQHLYPDSNFDAYICTTCGEWHIGKIRELVSENEST